MSLIAILRSRSPVAGIRSAASPTPREAAAPRARRCARLRSALTKMTKEQVFQLGEDQFAKKKYAKARQYYSHVYETYPNDPLGRRALLRVADTLLRARRSGEPRRGAVQVPRLHQPLSRQRPRRLRDAADRHVLVQADGASGPRSAEDARGAGQVQRRARSLSAQPAPSGDRTSGCRMCSTVWPSTITSSPATTSSVAATTRPCSG